MLKKKDEEMKKSVKEENKDVKDAKVSTKSEPSETPGYNDLVSRAREVGLSDNASQAEVSKAEARVGLKLPSDHPSNV